MNTLVCETCNDTGEFVIPPNSHGRDKKGRCWATGDNEIRYFCGCKVGRRLSGKKTRVIYAIGGKVVAAPAPRLKRPRGALLRAINAGLVSTDEAHKQGYMGKAELANPTRRVITPDELLAHLRSR